MSSQLRLAKYNHQNGRVVQILGLKPELNYHKDKLKSVLDKAQKRRIAVISNIGQSKRGKSLFLNLIMRYLQQMGMSYEESELVFRGFNWSRSKGPHTQGINIWSEPFIFKNSEDKKELALFLLDVQGCFDKTTSAEDNEVIYAIDAIMSSLQLYHVLQTIQEPDLDCLVKATSLFRQFKQLDGISTGLPGMVYLVKDWQCDFNFGLDSGAAFIRDVMEDENIETERKFVRLYLQRFFADVWKCCLLPFPGEQVTQEGPETLKLADVKPKFKENAECLVKEIIDWDEILVKQSREGFTASGLLDLIDNFLNCWKSGRLSKTLSLSDVLEANFIDEIAKKYRDCALKVLADGFLIKDDFEQCCVLLAKLAMKDLEYLASQLHVAGTSYRDKGQEKIDKEQATFARMNASHTPFFLEPTGELKKEYTATKAVCDLLNKGLNTLAGGGGAAALAFEQAASEAAAATAEAGLTACEAAGEAAGVAAGTAAGPSLAVVAASLVAVGAASASTTLYLVKDHLYKKHESYINAKKKCTAELLRKLNQCLTEEAEPNSDGQERLWISCEQMRA